MSQGLFPRIATELDLNGPILLFTSNPVGVATTSGASVTLSGFATAFFSTTGTPDNAGSISYQWYEVNVGALSDNTEFTGTGTTQLTISNLTTPSDNNRKFFLEADYNPAGQTGNANNEPLRSGIGTITVIPNVEIIAQPSNAQVNRNVEATFTIDAGLTDSTFGDVSYQWVVDGDSVSDGTTTKTTTSSTTVATPVERTFSSDGSLQITNATDLVITVAGASGGRGGDDSGGPGASSNLEGRAGTFTYLDGTRNLSFKIGRRGDGGSSGNQSAGGNGGASSYAAGGHGGGAGQDGWSGGGGGGGGATAVYDSVKGGHTIVAAGGGGGGGGSWNRAGSPGGPSVGLGFGRVDLSDSQSSPDPGDRGPTKNGDGGGGGGGGGGAKPSNFPRSGEGGGAGQDNSVGGIGGFGGASGFDSNYATQNSDGFRNNGDGFVNVRYNGLSAVDSTVTRRTTISGSNTSTLTLASNQIGIQTVRCIVSSDLVPDLPFDDSDTNSPVLSDVVDFITLDNTDQFNINIESIGDSSTASLSTINLANGEHEFTLSKGDLTGSGRFTKLTTFYSPDKDINLEMDLFGGKGDDRNGNSGGEGGFSRIRFTMSRNTEYVIAGLIDTINTPYIYRKGTLIACVGGGGNAGQTGGGGNGGGINIDGSDGLRRGSGDGGISPDEGTLQSDGVFGSLTNITAILPDTKATVPNGGRVLKCTKGVYWAQLGISPCTDLASGNRFILSDGTLVTNTSDSITRGYKDGYNIIQTAGKSIGNGGNGGNGATGGSGGDNAGGGGGSGYTNGEVTVVDNQLGGSDGDAKVIIRVVPDGRELVTFTQTRTSSENIQIVLTLESGNGPNTITLGSAAGFTGDLPTAVTAEIQRGAIYNVTSTTNVDASALNNGTAIFSDIDSNPGSLSITPDKGEWDSTVRYQFL